jgi:hypothetical protein
MSVLVQSDPCPVEFVSSCMQWWQAREALWPSKEEWYDQQQFENHVLHGPTKVPFKDIQQAQQLDSLLEKHDIMTGCGMHDLLIYCAGKGMLYLPAAAAHKGISGHQLSEKPRKPEIVVPWLCGGVARLKCVFTLD